MAWPLTISRIAGSPPRAWGRLWPWLEKEAANRFTPTCVGKAAEHGGRVRAASVHPHVRGEGLMYAACVATMPGSPPRAWGRLLCSEPIGV